MGLCFHNEDFNYMHYFGVGRWLKTLICLSNFPEGTPYIDGLHIDGIQPKGPTRHAYAWQIGPFWQDTLDIIAAMGFDVMVLQLWYEWHAYYKMGR